MNRKTMMNCRTLLILGNIMGSTNTIKCNNCSFLVGTKDNLVMSVCDLNLDYFDCLYCLNCQKIVKVWRRKNGKDMENKCPECSSSDVILEISDDFNIKCPKCKNGNLKSEILCHYD